MHVEHLVGMANDIANFFDAELGPEAAPQAIATHLARYWDPRMRRAILQHLATGGAGLLPSALEALQSLPPVKPVPERLSAAG